MATIRQQLNNYKQTQGCDDCKLKLPYWLLDFDHRPGEIKAGSVSDIASNKSVSAVWAEVAKCDVVCVQCHRIRTYTRNPW